MTLLSEIVFQKLGYDNSYSPHSIRKDVLHFWCHGPFGTRVKLYESLLGMMFLSAKNKTGLITREANYIKIVTKMLY